MAILRAGGSAVDAVEIAIKILEDREITNAGYGSNLAMDGVVECDAVVVDHNGRSGGVGAVARKSCTCPHMKFSSSDQMQRSKTPYPSLDWSWTTRINNSAYAEFHQIYSLVKEPQILPTTCQCPYCLMMYWSLQLLVNDGFGGGQI